MRVLQAARGAPLSEDVEEREADEAVAPARRPWATLVGTGAIVLLLDLATKMLADDLLAGRLPIRLLGGALYLSYVRNPGAAWGLGGGYTLVLTLVAVAVVVALVRFARRLGSTPWAVALGLILGGALGNLVDRIFRSPGPLRGEVVDFISVFDDDGDTFPVFNLADSALVVGVCLVILLEFTGRRLDGSRVADSKRGATSTESSDGT